MKYNQLNLTKHSSAKRVGRGIAAGQGKTAGRGTKGQGARKGFSKRPGFEGGQNPLMQRLPKLRGFHSHRLPAENIYTDQLNALSAKTVDAETLSSLGLISSSYARIKLLKNSEIAKPLNVKLPAASQAAIDSIEAAGGSFSKTAQLMRPKISTKSITPKARPKSTKSKA
ncbi:MAG: 50S ribosomal protein L15 [Candidatus Saccharimonadales bacterium]